MYPCPVGYDCHYTANITVAYDNGPIIVMIGVVIVVIALAWSLAYIATSRRR